MMLSRSSVTLLAVALLAGLPINAEGLYTKSSPVLQVDAKSYESLIAQSNHTSILEFYAPWCGHCKNLKPAYEKAAKNLEGLAKVGAINCDDDANKVFCGSMGVQGFPTLKIVKPTKKSGKPLVEDYQGQRTAKGIVDAVVDKIPNHVMKLQDPSLDKFLTERNETAKAILFTEKGTTSALLRALAVDFLGGMSFAQIRNKEDNAIQMFGISSFPTLLLLPGGDKKGLLYGGEMKKEPMIAFLSRIVAPNPDPAPKKSKSSTSKTSPKSAKSRSAASASSFSDASASHRSGDASSEAAGATSIVLEEHSMPTESPDPIIPNAEGAPTPVHIPDLPPPLASLATPEELQQTCLSAECGTCVLALLPRPSSTDRGVSDSANDALASLAEVADKHAKRQGKLFPFYSVQAPNSAATTLRSELGLKDETELEVVAVNGKRGWWRRLDAEAFNLLHVESWIDEIRLGDGSKATLPQSVLLTKVDHDEFVHNTQGPTAGQSIATFHILIAFKRFTVPPSSIAIFPSSHLSATRFLLGASSLARRTIWLDIHRGSDATPPGLIVKRRDMSPPISLPKPEAKEKLDDQGKRPPGLRLPSVEERQPPSRDVETVDLTLQSDVSSDSTISHPSTPRKTKVLDIPKCDWSSRLHYSDGPSFEHGGNLYLCPIAGKRPSWHMPDPSKPWVLQVLDFVTIWTAWGLDIEQVKDRQEYFKKVRRLAKVSFTTDKKLELFLQTAERTHISALRTGIAQWVKWVQRLDDATVKKDVLKTVTFITGYAVADGLKDSALGSRALSDPQASLLFTDSAMGPGRASEQKRRRADVEDVVETSRHKRARTWSPSLPGCGTSLSVPAQPVLNQFGLFLNDVAYIKRLPGVRHDATFEENCPAFTQGLANIRQESKRLGRKMDFMQHAPNTGTIRGLYECLLRELQSRVVSPSGAQHSLVTVVTSKGPSKASPIPAPDQLSEKLLAAVIEKHKKQLRVQNKAVTVRSEYQTVQITADLQALVTAISKNKRSVQHIRGAIAEGLGYLANNNAPLKAFNGQVFSRKGSAGQNQAYEKLVTFLSAEVSTCPAAGAFIPGPNAEILRKAKESEQIGITIWFTKDRGGLDKVYYAPTHAQTTRMDDRQGSPTSDACHKQKIQKIKIKRGHNPEDYGDGLHVYKSVTYEFRSLRTTLTERMDLKRRFEAKVSKALLNGDEFSSGHFSIGGTSYVKIS